ncbi:MAG: TetR family transcriptional regulator [Desulfobulbus oligotrophicus]|jgi:TetR/AcrR family acrAB operon transcriptional repressor|nr:TetR family transcriptional regulator [Desulfobulbus oligotrophicus]
MARRSKEEALETRSKVLDAALRVFSLKGVARSSLADIAKMAGVSRGAIYWHFANKGELLTALWDQVVQLYAPLAMASENPNEPDPLGKMKTLYISFLTNLVDDPRQQQMFRILFDASDRSKDTEAFRQLHITIRRQRLQSLLVALRNIKEKGQLPPTSDEHYGAVCILCFIHGLLANWIMTPDLFDLKKEAPALVEGMIRMLSTDKVTVEDDAQSSD